MIIHRFQSLTSINYYTSVREIVHISVDVSLMISGADNASSYSFFGLYACNLALWSTFYVFLAQLKYRQK